MTNNIHPTAVVDDKATLGKNIEIGPYSIVGPNVILHDGVKLHSHCVVDGHTEIGSGTQIYSFAAIGTPPQDLKYSGEQSTLSIGKNNVIREHVTMNPGTETGGMKTVVGDNCLFMVGVHIAHDCILGNGIIMANNATLGGHVTVGDKALIGGLAAVHQFIRIGECAVIGGMSGVESDVIPYGRVKGERASLAGLNLVGLDRQGFKREEIRTLQKVFKTLFEEQGTLDERLHKISNDYQGESLVDNIVEFARKKTRFPLCQPPKKAV